VFACASSFGVLVVVFCGPVSAARTINFSMYEEFMLDIHKYDVKLQNANRLLEESQVLPENKNRIQAFVRFLVARSVSKPRIYKSF